MRPQMAAYYEEADVVTQTALIISGIALAHAFVDGNKRTALLAGTTFLDLNGFTIQQAPGGLGRQIEGLVLHTGGVQEATERLVAWLRDHVVPDSQVLLKDLGGESDITQKGDAPGSGDYMDTGGDPV